MIVTGVAVSDGSSTRASILEWMRDLPKGRPWTDFANEIRYLTIQPGGEIVLLELTDHEGDRDFARCRGLVRSALAPLTVHVKYTNIYNTPMPPTSKPLLWFGRITRPKPLPTNARWTPHRCSRQSSVIAEGAVNCSPSSKQFPTGIGNASAGARKPLRGVYR